ncbi:MAG TPA: cytochrome c oxidase subunit II [Pseudonocardia sp.]|jgi:cytochrome c oxidase subunit II|nr:cytochrome c oxidase subunit II [Pseudonocardia sp.]
MVVLPFTTGCSMEEVLRFGWPVGVTPQAEAMREFWTWSTVAALVVGAITWGAMFWAILLHRKRRDDDGTLPRQTQYNLPLEVVFTVIPTIIVSVLFGFTVAVQNFVFETTEDPDVRIAITGFQWNWQFAYPDTQLPGGGVVTELGTSDRIPLLVLPTQRSIQFYQESEDVVHSFWVPEFLFKRDVFPLPDQNDQDPVWQISQIDTEGAFVGRCAELCGTYHAFMNFEVRALAPELYDRYITLRQQVSPGTGQPYTSAEALAELDCGELCTPTAITTYPFTTDRTLRSASEQPGG